MAGIDKTYVNWEQYKEVKSFFTKEMKKKQKEDLGYFFGYADWKKRDFNNGELPVWNTPSIVDLWLAQNCKLDFIQERLHQQYSDNWIGWLDLDFSEKGFLVLAESKYSYIAPFKNLEKEEEIEVYNELIVYGTTYAQKFLYEVLEGVVRGELYKNDNQELLVGFEIFGLYIKYQNGKYFVDKKEVSYGYFPKPYLMKGEKDGFYKHFLEYKIKHSYKKKDAEKYAAEQIIMSHENECFNIDQYKDFEKHNMNRYIMLLPRHIRDYVK